MRLKISEHIKLTEIEGQYVLLDCRKNLFYAVGRSGAKFLKEIQTHGDLPIAIRKISIDYKMPYETIEQDMITFLNLLKEKGLVNII